MKRRYLLGLLIVFVVANLVSTFWQNYQLPLDGDLVAIVLPASWYEPVLHDPFGLAVLTKQAVYAGPNRFFAHATLGLYWKQMPHLLQVVMSPISSLYAASALFTTVTVALLLFTLAAYVQLSGLGTRARWGLWLAAALMVPLFHTEGFYEQIGISNRAITYTTFYAFPMALLLLLWPFYEAAHRRQPLRVSPLRATLLVLLMVVIAFNGPIPVAVVAVVLLGIGLYWLSLHWGAAPRRLTLFPDPNGWLSGQAILLLAVLAGLCAYSLYIGRYNIENTHTHTLKELYALLPKGVYQQLTYDWGLPLLLFVVVVNSRLIHWFVPASDERQRILRILRWITVFAVLYTLLLPFGGYRSYRPYLVRNDSILPVLLGIIFAYGLTTYFLLFRLRGYARGIYLALILVLSGTFLYVDKFTAKAPDNGCERWSMDQMARSPEPIVHISDRCNVLTWDAKHDPNETELEVKMLQHWNVVPPKVKRYYQ
ncbi:hypothetical protein [Hymenobacter persicinus]|uniref:Glycosyltransferase RgtA/B/C/D-like domain-containing protein n=1 Tax=Hymenobacter persicinus TaxID=2025506 RepID=A0A4Q5LA11_9BACT|nr:hypothetical protein [Hymenobacter persicinus]RYU78422.1 hypothetical protein EWM57_14095 [Hymenobacter persicinus]